jgi:hypothetical protein
MTDVQERWENEEQQECILRDAITAHAPGYTGLECIGWARGVLDGLKLCNAPILRAHRDDFEAFAVRAAKL